MKTPIKLFYPGLAALGWMLFILSCCFAFQEEKASVQAAMESSLQEAVDVDYQERLNKVLVSYRPLGRKIKRVQIKCKEGIETISFEDSIREHSAVQLASQYVMTQINPVHPDSLHRIFCKEWEKNGVAATKTGIVYSHKQRKRFSANDSVSLQSAFVTPVRMIDGRKTAGVQAWAVITWTEIVGHFSAGMWVAFVTGFLALSWFSLFLLKRQRHKEMPATITRPDYLQIRKMTLKLESQKLYIDGQPCPLTPADFNLLLLFVKTPEHFLTKEDIKNCFWPKEDCPDNKIYTHISTLKAALKRFPGHQIMTLRKGYQLVLPA